MNAGLGRVVAQVSEGQLPGAAMRLLLLLGAGTDAELQARWAAAGREYIRDRHAYNARKVLELKLRVLELTKALAGASVEHVFLKGAGLLFSVYATDSACRITNDIDVIVHRRDLASAEAALAAIGYTPVENGERRAWFLAHHYHLRHAHGRIVVELHWDVDHAAPPALLAHLWATRSASGAGAARVPVPDPSMAVFLACFNLCKDRLRIGSWSLDGASTEANFYDTLSTFVEVDRILVHHGDRIDWDGLTRMLRECRLEFEILSLLTIAHEFALVRLPESISRPGSRALAWFRVRIAGRRIDDLLAILKAREAIVSLIQVRGSGLAASVRASYSAFLAVLQLAHPALARGVFRCTEPVKRVLRPPPEPPAT